ncbi:hypothetical protein ACFY3M_39045 [Streptomyces mirabilis]|uniref:hypothetical protein n=1 Tax=Streptomyces mirabilis TaxID=68239 RepID=UPI0036A15EEC
MNSATTTQTFAEETTNAEIVVRMVELYPGWENRRIPWHSTMAAIARKTGQEQPSDTGAVPTPRRPRPCAQIPPPSSPLEP